MTISQQAQQLQQPPTEIPETITSGNGKLVFYFIKTHNGVTIEEMSNQLNFKKLSLYSILQTLQSDDHVTKTDQEYF